MCHVCKRLKAEGVPLDQRPSHSPRGVEVLAARMKAKNAENHIKVPAIYATQAIRSARLRKIRTTVQYTQQQMADELGMSVRMYTYVESGERNCLIAYLKVAEELMKKHYWATVRARVKRRRITGAAARLANKAMKPLVIQMIVAGKSIEDVARELAIDPLAVEHWAGTLL